MTRKGETSPAARAKTTKMSGLHANVTFPRAQNLSVEIGEKCGITGRFQLLPQVAKQQVKNAAMFKFANVIKALLTSSMISGSRRRAVFRQSWQAMLQRLRFAK